MKYGLLICCVGLIIFELSAQSSYQLGTLPSVNVNRKLQKDWSLNVKLESRQVYQKGEFSGDAERGFDYQLTDLTIVGAKKVGFYSRVGAGYLLRFRDGKLIQRANQQFNYTKQYDKFRLSHRLMSDQTFFADMAPEFRFRYRISAQRPLNGTSLDLREFYLKFNNEYVNSWQESDYDLEIRLVPMLAFSINKQNKVEVGLDYRIGSFIKSDARNSFWLAINWFVEI